MERGCFPRHSCHFSQIWSGYHRQHRCLRIVSSKKTTSLRICSFTSMPEGMAPVISPSHEGRGESLQTTSAYPANTLWASVLCLEHHGASTAVLLGAQLQVTLIYSCLLAGICERWEITLWHRHLPDRSMPLTKGRGMQHLLLTEKAQLVLHIGSFLNVFPPTLWPFVFQPCLLLVLES